jgi:hypothetical protein
MANPTTNYGFVLPTASDLVTDLPADFDVALQGVDTRLKALQPGTTLGDLAYSSATANTNTRLPIGTTGQVLTVTGGVPAWSSPNPGDITAVTAGTGISGGGTSGDVTVTNSMATAMTTKGDIIVATGSGTFIRQAVGSNGQILTADSAEADGVRWATPAAAGGWTSIATGSLTGSSVSITSISGSYKKLNLVLSNVSTSSTTTFDLRFNNDTGNNYSWVISRNINGSTNFSPGGLNDRIQISTASQAAASTIAGGSFYLENYTETATNKIVRGNYIGEFATVGLNAGSIDAGWYSNAAITSIQIFPAGGTFDSGSYILYGIN